MRTHVEEKEQKVIETLKLFEGRIYQRPPIRASVKRRLRIRTIYSIDYLEGDGRNWLFKVTCESGTYIRKLCFDVGEILGDGAHMRELRRTRSGPFTDRLNEGNEDPLRRIIHPMETALELQPKIWIRDSAVEAICSGASLALPGILRFETGIEKGSMVAILTQKGEGTALMKAVMTADEIVELEHGIAATPLRVLMTRGTYPRMWKVKSALAK
jgi:H/ACA ribonucleoprotein complex subunit 4